MGTSIAPEAKAAVDMSVLQPDRATFFTTDGQVWIYPPQDIPPAETV
ncbi:MAG: hypothetical protein IPK83_10350 [Planctomycetes bacterium]|nr:hypothetical protein [Planctomycetota bacterium]